MIYVTSDLHGYPLEKFTDMLKSVNFSEDDTLYILGDIIDRGKDGIKLLRWCMQHNNVEFILGNHEAMMLSCDFLFDEITDSSIASLNGTKLDMLSNWQANGGTSTLEALSATRKEEIKYILEYLREAPLFEALTVNDRDFILCHSGLGNFSKDKKLSQYTSHELLWSRPTVYTDYFDNGITVIFGHTPTVFLGEKYARRACFTESWVNIDTGAALGYAPMLLRLDDMKAFYF